jgi:predicted ATP-dependent serine protease
MRFSELQKDVMLHGISPIEFLPLLGMEGYIRKGRSHLLSAYPKMGKTELMLQAIQQWPNEQVIYFTEESQETWEDRAYELGRHGESIDNLELVFALGLDPAVVLKYMEALPASVVVIDTIRDVLRPEDENDNAKVANCLRPYIALAREKQQTLIFLHHDSKRGGKEGRGVSGAHAFIGTVDIFLELEGGKTATQRKLSGRGRIKPIEDLIYERHDDGTMVAVDSGLTTTDRLILAALSFDWNSTSDIADSVEASTQQTLRVLNKLCSSELIERDPPPPENVAGKRVRWRLKVDVE